VERVLGVSPGYLSKLKLGRRSPSAEIVSALALVSASPKRRLAELDNFYNPPGHANAPPARNWKSRVARTRPASAVPAKALQYRIQRRRLAEEGEIDRRVRSWTPAR